MATLREYFDNDFPTDLKLHTTWTVKSIDEVAETELIARLHWNSNSNAMFLSFYLPETSLTFHSCVSLIDAHQDALKMNSEIQTQVSFRALRPLENPDVHSLFSMQSSQARFTGRVFIYSEKSLEKDELNSLQQYASDRALYLVVRDSIYAQTRTTNEKPLAFICHDSRDKNDIVRPLAENLSRMIIPIWYDEYSLRIGDSLRESIEKGLKECQRCILVLSPNFLTNTGWTKREFNSIFTREILEQKNVILPIWHNVTKHQIFEYSPSVLDKKAFMSSDGIEEITRQIARVIISAE